MGALVGLQAGLTRVIGGLDTEAQPWEVPPLIRADWVHWKVWADPPEADWCFEQPGGNILTPRPLLHLVNRLRHHPVDEGTFLLSGSCTRNEDPDATLPLLRQRTFRMLEFSRVDSANADASWSREMLDRLWAKLTGLDLPVQMVEIPGGDGTAPGIVIRLQLKAAEQVSLARSFELPAELLKAYKLEGRRIWTIGIGPERCSLGVLARWGVGAEDWPVVN